MEKSLISILLQTIIETNNESGSLVRSSDNYFEKTRNIVIKKLLKQNKRVPKAKRFIRTIKSFPDEVFRSHFRMKKHTFIMLKNKLRPFWKKNKFGRPKLNLEMSLYSTIWRLATGCTFREISNLFNIGMGTAFNSYLYVTKTLFKLRRNFIKWPTENDQEKCVEGFCNLRKNPIPFVVGCVDGCHIPIKAPKEDAISYFNRKQFHSVLLQGVCGSSMQFIDIFFGYPGSCHDAFVWENSSLGQDLKTGQINLKDRFLLGDSAYPLSQYLIVPYRDNGFLTESQKKFNYVHSSTRVVIEQAYGRLKGMFRILKYIDFRNLRYIKFTVLSCIVLHNHIIQTEGATVEINELDNPSVEENELPRNESTEDGKAIRDRLAMLFCS